ncbi:MAG: lipopolysaccharide assembly LapA domain-containing protein [Alphaproteobacteria bacterium]
MKLITAGLGLVIAMLTISFAVSNRQSVTVSLWPTPFEVTMPLVALIVALASFFFILGYLFSWFRGIPDRLKLKKENKAMKKQVEDSEQQVKTLQKKVESTEGTKASKTKTVFFK